MKGDIHMYNQAAFILSENCNLNCSFCFQGSHDMKIKNMTDEIFLIGLHKCINEGIKIITLFGGEPLLNLTPIMRAELLKFKDEITLSIFTNGILLSDEIIDFFLLFPKRRINISCHTNKSIETAIRVANKCDPKDYRILLVVNEENFMNKFDSIEPILKKGAILTLLTEIPNFNFADKQVLEIYDRLYPYRQNLDEYELYTCDGNIADSAGISSEFIFTYDGKISLTAGVNLNKSHTLYSLDLPFKEIIAEGKDSEIKYFPWQCRTCPIKHYNGATCPKRWKTIHDFSMCRRQIFLHSIIKGDKSMLCDKIIEHEITSMEYHHYNNKITNIMLNVTDQCNFRCRMCFCDFADRYMTEEIANKGIEIALSRKSPTVEKLTVTFFGGEPLLNFDLVKKIIAKWGTQLEYSMTTNGSLLNDETLQFLFDNKVGLLLSIDGAEETQNYNRPLRNGAPSFDILAARIPKILEKYPTITFRSTIMPETAHLLHSNYQFARNMGFKSYFCTPDAYSEWSTETYDELQKQCLLISIDIIEDIFEGKQSVMPKFFMDGIIDFLRIQDGLTNPSTSPLRCGMGVYGFGVGASGIIAACQEHSTIVEKSDRFNIGNVWDGIDEDKHAAIITAFQEEKAEWLHNECHDCNLREICINRVCPSRQEFMFGTFTKHAKGDCMWVNIEYNVGKFVLDFFTKHYSKNFEIFLEELLKNNNLGFHKEMTYNV
jgi:uncharacterized protein